jgi:hypothetical protein
MSDAELPPPVRVNKNDSAGRWKWSAWCSQHDRHPDECWEIHNPGAMAAPVEEHLAPTVLPRCEDFDTVEGVFYHAHDLPRCQSPAVVEYKERRLCQRHLEKRMVSDV